MNHERQQRNIEVRINSVWVPVSDETEVQLQMQNLKMAYTQYKNKPTYHTELPHCEGGIKIYRDDNNHYNPTYALNTRQQHGSVPVPVPIIDLNDVKIFLTDLPSANWVKARDYQAWAYRDFVYDSNRAPVKYYASQHSSHLFFQTSNYRQVTIIDVDGLPPNIIFKISRNENGSVYYEKNDYRATRIRICDNESARSGYLGYYRRMTDVGDFIISTPVPAPSQVASSSHDDPYGPNYQDFASFLHQPRPQTNAKLPLPPGICSVETNNEEEQCILCFKNKANLKISPCGHKIICPECYKKLEKEECPMCREKIQSLSCSDV